MTEPAVAVAPAASPIDLSALGVYTADEAAADAFARCLVLGPPKRGKTTAIVTTAPAPFVINCDGDSALKYPAKLRAKFLADDVATRRGFKAAIVKAEKLVDAGLARTIVVDSITLLADSLLDEITLTLEGYEIWTELAKALVGGVKRLFTLPAHVFMIAHMVPAGDTGEGIVPLIGGQAKIKIPAIAHDCVLFDYNPDRKPERQFLIGPQKEWHYSGRNVKRSCAVDATVPAMFAELGIAL